VLENPIEATRLETAVADTLTGGCCCKAIEYRISGRVFEHSLCHCPSCRRAAGASPVGWLIARAVDFTLTKGKPIYLRSSPGVERGFCGACGTTLTYQELDYADTIDVTAATLDDQTAFTPRREVWTQFRAAWLAPLPSAVQFLSSGAGKPVEPRPG
jgi:hypothetical protein